VRQHGVGGKTGIMQLDLPTLMVMQSFALACAGTVLLAAWSQNPTVRTLALWGIAHIIAAGGILSLMLGFTSQQPIWLGLGGGLLSFQSALVWKAARNTLTRSQYRLLSSLLDQ